MVEFPDKSWRDYELIDSGDGEKLERFGAYVISRPEPKALWRKSLPQSEWDSLAHTCFKPGAGFGKAGKEDSGTWERLHKMEDQWWIRYPLGCSAATGEAQAGAKVSGDSKAPAGAKEAPDSLRLRLGLTSFKHVGVFPEQAPNWEFIYGCCRRLDHPKVLNLFAYTGAASLAACAGGAEVTHLDSVRQVVTWARGNMERTGLDGIRWVVEDAMKFARREARRGNLYDGIILDPPAYGHGPDGEKWKLDECLFEMLCNVAQILKPHGFVVLNLYSNGYSAALGETLVREAFGIGSPYAAGEPAPRQTASLSSGELALVDSFGKALPLSIVVRLQK